MGETFSKRDELKYLMKWLDQDKEALKHYNNLEIRERSDLYILKRREYLKHKVDFLKNRVKEVFSEVVYEDAINFWNKVEEDGKKMQKEIIDSIVEYLSNKNGED